MKKIGKPVIRWITNSDPAIRHDPGVFLSGTIIGDEDTPNLNDAH